MLAELAAQTNKFCLVIDCYADLDTQALAEQCIKVDSLSLGNIKAALAQFQSPDDISYVIYGSGFERYPESLEFLQRQFILIGNTAEEFKAINDKTNFFTQLRASNIAYPETSFVTPIDADDWLIKPMQGEGGLGIKSYQNSLVLEQPCYWQKRITGASMSVLFLANGTNYTIYGYHQQLFKKINNNEFVFSGIINLADVKLNIRQQIELWLSKLLTIFKLKGFNSLDFIVNNETCYVLEVNARPSASLQLYPAYIGLAHCQSFFQKKLTAHQGLTIFRAYKIIYAENNIRIKTAIQWPVWVKDIPQTGLLIYTGMPICSIIAGGKNEQQINQLLLLREQYINNLLR